tara:strand:- start:101 stop:301 length:201 start_codon:yes stop_codon:yes gene_type:complete
MYGDGVFFIKDVDIWKNKLRLTIADVADGSYRYVFMKSEDAQRLVNDIWFKVEDHQNAIRQRVVNE